MNQNQTYREEVDGQFMWSPKRQKNEARSQFYDNMLEVTPGDIVFSFRNARISAIGMVMGRAEEGAKPDFHTSPASWSQDGWVVPVFYAEFEHPIRPADHMAQIGPLLPQKYSRLQANGRGLQSVYLASLTDELGEVLVDLTGVDLDLFQAAANPAGAEQRDIEEVLHSVPEAATEIDQLVKARRGQGVFKQRVQQIEPGCRVTGTAAAAHLRASHIKPWRDASNDERLDGNNGLLLAPHVDHLFDRGWISFADDGALLVSKYLEPGLLESWGISYPRNVGAFAAEQCVYLEFHRDRVFERSAAAPLSAG